MISCNYSAPRLWPVSKPRHTRHGLETGLSSYNRRKQKVFENRLNRWGAFYVSFTLTGE